jgi:diguanylate cyclase
MVHVKEKTKLPTAPIVKLAAGGTAAFLALSLSLNYLMALVGGLTAFQHSLVTALVLPILIGLPLLVSIGILKEEIGTFRRQLTRAATYDPATDVYRGTVFSSVVDRRVSTGPLDGPRRGAFLVVDMSNFREINARFGLDWGEEALRIVASTIRASLRSDDLVGRLAEGEFGIFLPGASAENARHVGERIKQEVARVYFAPGSTGLDGKTSLIDVNVAGVFFEQQLGFEDMFRSAQKQLSSASPGNGVEVRRIESPWQPGLVSSGQVGS